MGQLLTLLPCQLRTCTGQTRALSSAAFSRRIHRTFQMVRSLRVQSRGRKLPKQTSMTAMGIERKVKAPCTTSWFGSQSACSSARLLFVLLIGILYALQYAYLAVFTEAIGLSFCPSGVRAHRGAMPRRCVVQTLGFSFRRRRFVFAYRSHRSPAQAKIVVVMLMTRRPPPNAAWSHASVVVAF